MLTHFQWFVLKTHFCPEEKQLPVQYYFGKSLLVLHCDSLRTSAFAKQRLCNGRYYLYALIAISYCCKFTHLKYKSTGIIYPVILIIREYNLYIHFSSELGRSTYWYFGVTQF